MSSRALRKLQKEQELQRSAAQAPQDVDSGSDRDLQMSPASKKMNTFDMLNTDEGAEEYQPMSEDETADVKEPVIVTQSANTKTKKSKKKKGKKKKVDAKSSNIAQFEHVDGAEGAQLDEIDLALRSLSIQTASQPKLAADTIIYESTQQLYRLLAVESKHLNALSEMKRLFGNVVLEAEDDPRAQGRRRGRGPRGLDLSAALAARNNPSSQGQGLSGSMLRRNFLIQGKEEWPKATGGGLGMELVEQMDDGTIEYRFVHNNVYQDVQRQFESCVQSMDPQRMISLLVWNPYHISTLLQVSEIAKQQGDHSVSGDLLERALFNFGRSSQSSFTNALQSGKARLDFRRPENREFWLAAWRYMVNLGQRGTWRTAYEWAKLILSLDPEGDPYGISKVIDQLALRGGQFEHFDELFQNDFYKEDLWANRANIAISSALVDYRLKRSVSCRDRLVGSVEKYPWVFARLFQELNIERIPKVIWGMTPRTPAEKLECEEYVHNAKDLWNTPETTAFLVEVIEFEVKGPVSKGNENHRDINIDDARYALLTAVPSIINCIPRALTNLPTTSYDPFPPPENLPSYDATAAGQPSDSDADDDDEIDEELAAALARSAAEVQPSNEPSAGVERGDSGPYRYFFDVLGSLRALVGGRRHTAENTIALSAEESALPADAESHLPQQDPSGRQEPSSSTSQSDSSNPPIFSNLDALRQRVMIEMNLPADMPSEEVFHRLLDSVESGQIPSRNQADMEQWIQTEELIQLMQNVRDAATGGSSNNTITPARQLQGQTPSSSSAEGEAQERQPPPSTNSAPPPPNWQNWLAGRGIALLKSYTAEHSLDPSSWPPPPPNSSPSSAPPSSGEAADESCLDGRMLLHLYATRLLSLPDENRRRFILDHALRQGAGEGVSALVREELGRVGRGKG